MCMTRAQPQHTYTHAHIHTCAHERMHTYTLTQKAFGGLKQKRLWQEPRPRGVEILKGLHLQQKIPAVGS